jgi:hypothetical protein
MHQPNIKTSSPFTFSIYVSLQELATSKFRNANLLKARKCIRGYSFSDAISNTVHMASRMTGQRTLDWKDGRGTQWKCSNFRDKSGIRIEGLKKTMKGQSEGIQCRSFTFLY